MRPTIREVQWLHCVGLEKDLMLNWCALGCGKNTRKVSVRSAKKGVEFTNNLGTILEGRDVRFHSEAHVVPGRTD